MVRIDIVYQGELRCEATHEPSGNVLLTDAPVDNHGKGESFSPTDLVATALGTCIASIMGIVAERHDVNLRGMRVTVVKSMAAEPVRHISKLNTILHIPVDPPDDVKKILERAALSCPVHASLGERTEKPVLFRWGQA
jgi:putative redox protein